MSLSRSRLPPSRNRTNVRFTRALVRVGARLLPSATEAWAAAAFSRTRGPRHHEPPRTAAGALARHTFALPFQSERLAVYEWGVGPTVLLVHGWNGHAAQMQAFIEPLCARGFHVVAFDHPGHGRSSGQHATLLTFRDALLAVARRLAPVHGVIAHSLGATGTVLALHAGLAIERAVLLAPPAEMAPFVAAFGRAVRLPAARVAGVLARVQRNVGIGDLPSLDVGQLAVDTRARTLVMHDPSDRSVPFAHGRRIAERLAGARLAAADGVGHDGLLTDPAAVAQAVAFV